MTKIRQSFLLLPGHCWFVESDKMIVIVSRPVCEQRYIFWDDQGEDGLGSEGHWDLPRYHIPHQTPGKSWEPATKQNQEACLRGACLDLWVLSVFENVTSWIIEVLDR